MDRRGRSHPRLETVVSELEGALLKNPDPFCYFMLVAFEASGLIRFTLLLILWPVIRLLDIAGFPEMGLRLAIFVAVAGIKASEIETVARAVLPKFFMDDVDMEAWKVFSSYEKRVVVSKCPRIMVEMFVKEHLRAEEVVAGELLVNRFGYATGLVNYEDGEGSVSTARVKALLQVDQLPDLGLARKNSRSSSVLSSCKEILHPPFFSDSSKGSHHLDRPIPVIFHDGRLVRRPTPATSLLTLLWLPVGVLVAAIRIGVGLVIPIWAIPYIVRPLGGDLIVRGQPPPPVTSSTEGVLFVCTHRTLIDPVALSIVLCRRVPAVTYSISRLSELISPIPTIRLTRDREVDARRIKRLLAKGDLVVCPEGTTCREPFLLRFSALFAGLTDRIVPVAMNCRVGFFHGTTARGWKALDPIFLMMNPRPAYEVTFLNQLPVEATCSAGKSPCDVANYVQRLLAATLGFECTNFTRKDKYRVLAGNDGTVPAMTPYLHDIRRFLGSLLH